MKILQLMVLFVAFSSLFSCVSNRRFQDEVIAKSTALAETEKAQKEAQEATDLLSSVTKERDKLKVSYKELKSDNDLLQQRYTQQQNLNKDLQDSYDKLLELNEKLREDATDRKRKLSEELVRKEADLTRKERELQRKEDELRRERERIEGLNADLKGKNNDISGLQDNLAAREQRVKELEQAIAERDAKAKALQDKLQQALMGFKASDLNVEMRNGKVYVSLSQNLLFKKGSSALDSKGASAIEKLAEVLNKNTEIDVLVEGHTDSDGAAKANWKLSSDRSLAIVDKLIAKALDPQRITAAGRGEHAPIAKNDSEDGKSKNRRTEIILSPKLNEIINILNN